MIVIYDATRAPERTLRLEEPEVFTALKLVVHGERVGCSEASAGLRAIGRWDGFEHVYLQPELLRSLAGSVTTAPEWELKFTGMLAYARESDWIDADDRVKLHVEYVHGV